MIKGSVHLSTQENESSTNIYAQSRPSRRNGCDEDVPLDFTLVLDAHLSGEVRKRQDVAEGICAQELGGPVKNRTLECALSLVISTDSHDEA
jgi:hypothetical protein